MDVYLFIGLYKRFEEKSFDVDGGSFWSRRIVLELVSIFWGGVEASGSKSIGSGLEDRIPVFQITREGRRLW